MRDKLTNDIPLRCSNRTFMELKSRINHNTYIKFPKVLIVPLWN